MTRPSNNVVVPLRWFENFGAPPEEPTPPPPIEPVFTAAQMAEARQTGWNDGYIAACRAQLRAIAEETRRGLDDLLRQSETMDRRLEHLAERNARMVAAWLGDLFIAALPDLETAAMDSRIAVAAQRLSGLLSKATGITVKAADEVVAECGSLEEAWRAVGAWRSESAVNAPITIDWDSGRLRIDPQQNWRDIAALQPFLVPPAAEAERLFSVVRPAGVDDVG
ncbi:hypothetical protein [Rhodopila sp.]|uniref:hypothetical protein n=1 Tax=Rhodopila sp. TaxID=2480087 RepID=UPI002C29C1F5|nr:hypothetical protein [Rhodopila sp.]HVZ08663.1 hypothetical protein [Rhodopila sp.]